MRSNIFHDLRKGTTLTTIVSRINHPGMVPADIKLDDFVTCIVGEERMLHLDFVSYWNTL